MDQNPSTEQGSPAAAGDGSEVHHQIGLLTRQLHDALRGLGLADKLHGAAEELPDARSRLSYIARLTGEAAEKVLNRVDQAKSQHDHIMAQTQHMKALLTSDPVGAVSKGHIMNFLLELEKSNAEIDQHLTEIMMAQDFHDLTGQVIKRVVGLATNLEDHLIQLLLQTAPPGASVAVGHVNEHEATQSITVDNVVLDGPVVHTESSEVVTSQSQVDDLLASLGF